MSFVDDNTPVTVVQMEENDIDFNVPMGETDIALPDSSTGDNSYPDPLHSQFGSEDDSNHNDNGFIFEAKPKYETLLNNNFSSASISHLHNGANSSDGDDNIHNDVGLNMSGDHSILNNSMDISTTLSHYDGGDNSDGRIYQCQLCDKSFRHVKSLRDHKQKHYGITYKCEMCFKILSDKKNIKRHRSIHMDVNYPCPECDESFQEKIFYVRHSLRHLPKQCFLCENCDWTIIRPEDLDAHSLLHPGIETQYVCTLCNFRCPMVQKLRQHANFHDKNFTIVKDGNEAKPVTHMCPTCDRLFPNSSALQQHLKQSHKNEKFTCEICNKTYSKRATLKKHKCIDDVVLTLTPEKPSHYDCQYCGKSFIRIYSRNRHELTHTNTRKHECMLCDAKVARGDKFTEHLRVKHHMKRSVYEQKLRTIQAKEEGSLLSNLDAANSDSSSFNISTADIPDISNADSSSLDFSNLDTSNMDLGSSKLDSFTNMDIGGSSLGYNGSSPSNDECETVDS